MTLAGQAFGELKPNNDSFRGWIKVGALLSPLNTGMMNILETTKQEKTNCTDGTAIFGASSSFSYDATEKFVFNAFSNFWSCASYPNVSRDMRDRRMSEEDRGRLTSAHMDTTIASSASVANFLSTCVVAYCDDFPMCDSTRCTNSELLINGTMLASDTLLGCLLDICDAMPDHQFNPDIAGPGPIISYIIQVLMSFSLPALYLTLLRVIPSSTRLLNDFNFNIDKGKLESRLHIALEIALITLEDFQRAQCCFAVANNIAAAATLRSTGNYVSEYDRIAILAAVCSGITAPCIVLVVLMAFNQRKSALTFWFTCFTWISSLSVAFMLSFSSPSARSYPQACAEFSPESLCTRVRPLRSDWADLHQAKAALYLPVVLMPIFLMWYNWSHTKRLARCFTNRPVSESRPSLYPNGISKARFTELGASNRNVAFVTCIFLIICFLSFSLFLGNYFKIGAVSALIHGQRQDWTFGQIVSLTVWFPVLLSLANNAIYGPMQGRTEQLPDSLEVMRVSTISLRNEQTAGEQSDATVPSSDVRELVAIRERSNTVPTRHARASGEQNVELERHATLP